MKATTNSDRHTARTRAPQQLVPRTWENAKWADSGLLEAWVRERVAAERFGPCGVSDAIATWRDRPRVSFWAIDRTFTKLGLHVAQLPDWVWVG